MNDMEKFLNFSAVVKVKRSNNDDLWNFLELIKSVGFLDEYINYFQKKCCTDSKYNEYTEDEFWRLVSSNCKDKYSTCIEFQWGKGFNFSDEKDYKWYDPDMKIISVNDLIKSCNMEEKFKLNYQYTSFEKELKSKNISEELDEFTDLYSWSIVKFPNNKFNIKDDQTNSFDFEENTTIEDIINRVYFRMLDFFMYEDIDSLMEDCELKYIKNKYENYIKIGKELNLINEEREKNYSKDFEKITSEYHNEIEKDI